MWQTLILMIMKYYIWNTKTDESFDTNENRFYSASWDIVFEEKDYLQIIIENDPERFVNCIIVSK